MDKYKLGKEEVVLFKGKANCVDEQDKIAVDLLLTNLNFVFTATEKDEREIIDAYEVKVYRENYQIIQKKNLVEIYFTDTEKYLEFETPKVAKEFTAVALRLVSGYSKFVRGVKKAQKEVSDTEEALGVDIKETTKKVGAFAGEVAIVMGENIESPKMKLFGNIAKGIKEASARNKLRKEIASEKKPQLTNGNETEDK